jgi:hypothetical protein
MIASSWSFGVIIMTGSSGTRRRGDSSRPGLIIGEGTTSVRPEERAAIGATLPAPAARPPHHAVREQVSTYGDHFRRR